MPEVTFSTTMNLPPESIWEFVKDMNNWAPFLTGYQGHEIKSETHSIWTLKGDVGILSRTVRLDVNITEWDGPRRVSFTLTGLNEMVEGDGTLEMSRYADGGAASNGAPSGTGGLQGTNGAFTGREAAPGASSPKAPGLLRRFLNWLMRALFRSMHGTVERKQLEPLQVGKEASRLTFRLRMDAGGPTGPLVNAMLEPALLPAAEDLGNKIAAHLEKLHGLA